MYQITDYGDNRIIGYTENPVYILKSSAGIYVPTDEEHAQGIAYKSVPYNLANREGVGADTTVILFHYDTGDVVVEQDEQRDVSADIDALTVDHELRITMLELGIDEF